MSLNLFLLFAKDMSSLPSSGVSLLVSTACIIKHHCRIYLVGQRTLIALSGGPNSHE